MKKPAAFYSAWRHFKAAHFVSVEDQSDVVAEPAVRRMLEIAGFDSVEDFNSEIARHAKGRLPKRLQERLGGLLDLTTSDDWMDRAFGVMTSDGFQSPDFPLVLADDAPPAEIEVSAMGFRRTRGSYSFGLSVGITAARLFKPKPGEEALCSLLIERQDRFFDQLSADEKRIFSGWLDRGGFKGVDVAEAYQSLRRSVPEVAESVGIMSATFVDASGREWDYFIECPCGEEMGLVAED